ncbi:MAG: methylenetetrahydrofolate reductase C-terminal domain-containing protein [Candidatus Altiarchaeota archaeon]
MIITKKKPYEEVKKALEGRKNVAVIGCGRCATTCETGGEKEVAEIVKLLESDGHKVPYSGLVEAQCDLRLSRLELRRLDGYDAVLSMACGSGASALSDLTDKPVVTSNDTMFLGVVRRHGDYVERCGMCGDCTISDTIGICVKTRCAKGLLNGPCGGSHDGKCEVGGERDCAWALVAERMRKAGRLEELGKRRG